MKLNQKRPVVGVLACRKQVGPLWSYTVAEKYLRALDQVCNVMPILIPSDYHILNSEQLFSQIDGLLLPGSVSNIEPYHYADRPVDCTDPRDSNRDCAAIKLVGHAIEHGKAVMGICRGFQEINVALGGTLIQRLEKEPDLLEHRETPGKELFEQFELSHDVILEKGGLLHSRINENKIRVNSLHGQGVKELGEGLIVEARATDGLIEAFRLDSEKAWVLGVQWHPEWETEKSKAYLAVFNSFAEACRERVKA